MREWFTVVLSVLIVCGPPAHGGGALCPWDCGDGNGAVDTVDFLALLADWGPGPGSPCDFDDNGVDTVDFLMLLAHWGPCPTCGPGAGPCFESHSSPGCEDVACCTTVCNDDPFCCAAQWDIQCVDTAFGLCDDAPGACCLPTGECIPLVTPDVCEAAGGEFAGVNVSCGSVECRDTTGACCLTDGTCTELSEADCDAAGGLFHGLAVECVNTECSFIECGGAGSCLVANGSPGCSDTECCNFVCSLDPNCCAIDWDITCAVTAMSICVGCGDLDAGSCFEAHQGTGCSDADCCVTMCAVDPFCCTTQWDQICVNGATQLCNQLDCEDPIRCQGPDLAFALLSDVVTFTEADNFVVDAIDPAPVNSLCWWGAYYSSEECGPGPDDFTVNYYTDVNGLPGVLVASFNQGGGTLTVAPAIATGAVINSGNVTEYEHTAEHADLLLTPGECYWIEIVNTGPVSGCRWYWETSSDGDDHAGQTAGGGPWEPKSRDFAFCLNVPLFGAPPCPCLLECPAGATDEGEACGADTNGGCNADPPVFGQVACNGPICGTAWADGNVRDTDWYLVNHTGGGLSATLTSQFPGVCLIADIDLDTCVGNVVGSIGCADECGPINEASASLPAGTYVIFVAPGDCNADGVFEGYPCGTSNEYVLEVTCPPTGQCCLGDDCQITTAAECVAMAGLYGGDGTSCPVPTICCLPSGSCVVTDPFSCFAQGGTMQGGCATCASCSCGGDTGACCLPSGTCIDGVTLGACFFAGGVYQGNCTTCASCP